MQFEILMEAAGRVDTLSDGGRENNFVVAIETIEYVDVSICSIAEVFKSVSIDL